MNDYIEARLDFEPCSEDIVNLASAFLAEAGFESFMTDSRGVTAYISSAAADGVDYDAIFADFPIETHYTVSTRFIEGRDWNHEWEAHYFKPIVIGEECVIHSSFHTDVPACRYDIVIDPKMAFGTGHHSTTSLMMRRLLVMELSGKSVIDMGTGTGILSIMAAMRGAVDVTGIEIDEAAYVNAVENVRLNFHSEIRLIHGDASALAALPPADLLLANINRNIILSDIGRYASALKTGGVMLLSGFYEADIAMIRQGGEDVGLVYDDFIEDSNWVSVKMHKP